MPKDTSIPAIRRSATRRRLLLCTSASLLGLCALFASAPASAQTSPLGSNTNYTLYNNCQNIEGLTVSLHVTQDMIANVTPGGGGSVTPNGGFALQLNADPPAGQPYFWLKYGIIIEGNTAKGFIQYWNNAGVNNHGQPIIANLPSNTIPAGWTLTIALTNDNQGNVTGTTFSITDNTGKVTSLQMPMPTIPGTNTPALVPIHAFQTNVVGPINWENAAFSSGAGYLTYGASSGALGVEAGYCSNTSYAQTGETSNASYGLVIPTSGTGLAQSFVTPSGGAIATNNDTAEGLTRLYHIGQNQQTGNYDIDAFAQVGMQPTGAWSLTDVSATTTAPAATLGTPFISYENTIYNATEAFYLVPDGQAGNQVEQLWSGSWSSGSLTAIANAQPAAASSGLAGFIDSVAGTDNVFYQGTDQHIHLLTWSPIPGWTEDKRLGAAPAAAFASPLTAHATPQSDEVFYLGTNQHLYELWRWSKNFDGWHVTDLTTANNVKPLPMIQSPLAGFYDPTALADAVFYVGTDQHLHQALFTHSQWSGIDITAATAAPLPVPGSGLAAHLNTSAGSEEVFYVTPGAATEELFTFSTTIPTWHAENPFASPVGTPVAANPSGAMAPNFDTQSNPGSDALFYAGTDGLVHELWSSSNSGGWNAETP